MLIYILKHLFNLKITPKTFNIEIYEHLRKFLTLYGQISRQHRISIIKFVSKQRKRYFHKAWNTSLKISALLASMIHLYSFTFES